MPISRYAFSRWAYPMPFHSKYYSSSSSSNQERIDAFGNHCPVQARIGRTVYSSGQTGHDSSRLAFFRLHPGSQPTHQPTRRLLPLKGGLHVQWREAEADPRAIPRFQRPSGLPFRPRGGPQGLIIATDAAPGAHSRIRHHAL